MDPLFLYPYNADALKDYEDNAKKSKTHSLRYVNFAEQIFYHDITICYKHIKELANPINSDKRKEETLFWYRTTTRSFISYTDGMIGVLKDVIRWDYERGELKLDDFDIEAINGNKRINIKKRKIYESNRSFEEHLDIVLLYFPKVFGINFKPDKTGDYRCFKECLKYRHSITHPNKPLDILISSENNRFLSKAPMWLHSTLLTMFTACK